MRLLESHERELIRLRDDISNSRDRVVEILNTLNLGVVDERDEQALEELSETLTSAFEEIVAITD